MAILWTVCWCLGGLRWKSEREGMVRSVIFIYCYDFILNKENAVTSLFLYLIIDNNDYKKSGRSFLD